MQQVGVVICSWAGVRRVRAANSGGASKDFSIQSDNFSG